MHVADVKSLSEVTTCKVNAITNAQVENPKSIVKDNLTQTCNSKNTHREFTIFKIAIWHPNQLE